jgi:hypothetical protein
MVNRIAPRRTFSRTRCSIAVSPDRIDPDDRHSRQVETRSCRSRAAAVSQSGVLRRRRKSFELGKLRRLVTLATLVTMNRGPFHSRRPGRKGTGFIPRLAIAGRSSIKKCQLVPLVRESKGTQPAGARGRALEPRAHRAHRGWACWKILRATSPCEIWRPRPRSAAITGRHVGCVRRCSPRARAIARQWRSAGQRLTECRAAPTFSTKASSVAVGIRGSIAFIVTTGT